MTWRIISVDGIILAGGESSRFGSDKARHLVNGERMVDLALEALRPHSNVVWLSVGESDDDYGLNLPILRDPEEFRGPLGGLFAGLQASRSEWIAVLACDMPAVRESHVERLIGEVREGDEAVISCSSSQRLQPVFGCYHYSLLPLMERNARSELYSLRALLDSVTRLRRVEFPPDVLLNANYPSDLNDQ